MTQDSPIHIPVLIDRVMELLAPALSTPAQEPQVVVDATLGLGGHSERILDEFPAASVIGLDRDTEAIRLASQRLERFGSRFVPVHTPYDRIRTVIETGEGHLFDAARKNGLSGALFDLGISSMQVDRQERGFSYSVDAPLDMRMDQTRGITAADIVNTYSHGQLARILSVYGDERFAGRIASAIIREREKEPFTTSARLVELIVDAIPAATRRTGGHPAKRTFQALRIEVNGELESLETALPAALDLLGVGGRAVFMAYQSHEDQIVKAELRERTTSKSPIDLPSELPGMTPSYRIITRGAERADEEEIAHNPRSASVRVRCIERLERSHQ